MTREELLAPIGLPPETLEGWEPVPMMIAGKHAGTLIVKGMEVHFALIEDQRVASEKRFEKCWNPCLIALAC